MPLLVVVSQFHNFNLQIQTAVQLDDWIYKGGHQSAVTVSNISHHDPESFVWWLASQARGLTSNYKTLSSKQFLQFLRLSCNHQRFSSFDSSAKISSSVRHQLRRRSTWMLHIALFRHVFIFACTRCSGIFIFSSSEGNNVPYGVLALSHHGNIGQGSLPQSPWAIITLNIFTCVSHTIFLLTSAN